MTTRQLVKAIIQVSYTKGRGVALAYNENEPIEVTVFVSHSWDGGVKDFFEDIPCLVAVGGIFISFLSIYQGTADEINIQVTQGSANPNGDAFASVLNNIKTHRGKMIVVPSDNMTSVGLFSRLWCCWEIFSAVRLSLPIHVHPWRRTEAHLFGDSGKSSFSSESSNCGDPLEKVLTEDEKRIRSAMTGCWKNMNSAIIKQCAHACESVCNLTSWGVGDQGAALVASKIKAGTTWKKLDCSNNMITDDGAKALASALQIDTYLEEMSLQDNLITDDGACVLAEAIEHSSSIELLDLRGNQIKEAGSRALRSAAFVNRVCVHLDT